MPGSRTKRLPRQVMGKYKPRTEEAASYRTVATATWHHRSFAHLQADNGQFFNQFTRESPKSAHGAGLQSLNPDESQRSPQATEDVLGSFMLLFTERLFHPLFR